MTRAPDAKNQVVCLAAARTRRAERTTPARLAAAAAAAVAVDQVIEQTWRSLGLEDESSSMCWPLRIDLRMASASAGPSAAELSKWIDEHRHGIAASLASARHEPGAAGVLAPECLLVLYGLDRRPDELRRWWPVALSELPLLRLADAFGRPFDD